MTSACVLGCSGLVLTDEEAAFFRDIRPWGFILFRRNIATPDQVSRLTQDLRAAIDRPDAPILVDQEGGRVQRLTFPHWPRYPAAGILGGLALDIEERRNLIRLCSRLIGSDLRAVGINVNCAPVLDVPVSGADGVIGDRAFGKDVETVATLGRAAAEGLLAAGVLPVVKHAPGHGRAGVDSHKLRPVVDTDLSTLDRTDFAPFLALADMPAFMTAHVVYSAIDAANPASTSSDVITRVIRGTIGFQGLLISDDLSMNALEGDPAARAEDVLAAGCDLALHCNGDLAEMRAVVGAVAPLTGSSAARAEAALACLLRVVEPWDEAGAWRRLSEALGVGRMG